MQVFQLLFADIFVMEGISKTALFLFVLIATFDEAAPNNIVIGDHVYFTDLSATLRSHTQALTYCQSQEAELAKVTNKTVYDRLRLALPLPSTYWIDGVDKENHERFALNTSCSPGQLDFSDMPRQNLDLKSKSCLSLVKGSNAANSRIQAMDCIILNRVLCSFPLNGCH